MLQVIEQEAVKGFPEVVVGHNISDCISHVIQVQRTPVQYSALHCNTLDHGPWRDEAQHRGCGMAKQLEEANR